MTTEQSNLATVHAFFDALRSGAAPDAIAAFYADDAIQEEFPNRLLAEGARRTVADIRDAAERGSKLMESQEYEILNAVASGDTVVVEAAWAGTLAVPIGEATPAGSVMRARFAQIFEFRNGKIAAQRNYDCFYPW